MKSRNLVWPIALLAVLLPCSVRAVDGVIEINQAKALAGGVVPGDSAGFPVTIDGTSGSFRLTSDLDLSAASADTNAIEIYNANVSIDLNGFTISGPNPCDSSCSMTGMGAGIYAQSTSLVEISNGFVEHMGADGLNIEGEGLVRDLDVTANGRNGVYLASGSVTNVKARADGKNGIYVGTGRVLRSFAHYNIGNGIRLDAGVLKDCEADYNYGDGLLVSTGTVIGNMTYLNGTGKHEFHCAYRCSYSQNNFSNCAKTQVVSNCVLGDNTILQVPASSNMCLDQICP